MGVDLNTATSYNQVNPDYIGKSLNQIRDQGMSFRPDVLAGLLGVSESSPLTKDQTYNMGSLPKDYAGNSSEGNAFRSIFNAPGQSPEMKAIQPAVNTMQASKAPLQQRYDDLIANIKGEQQTATDRQTVTTKNELARRGIVGGSLYDQTITDALNPINRFYTGQMHDASDQNNIAQNAVDQAIAQMQVGAGNSTIEDAFRQYQLQQAANEFAQNFGLQQKQFEQSKNVQTQNYGLASQNYTLEQAKLAQQLAQQQIGNNFTQQQIGISGGNLGVAQANQALAQKTYDAQYGNPLNVPSYFTPAR